MRKVYKLEISIRYLMRKVKVETTSTLKIENIDGFILREVTRFGTSAKVSCPKEFLGKKVYLVFVRNET